MTHATTAKVFAFKRPLGTSKKRVSLTANALDTLQGVGFSRDCEVDIATGGQFSIIDAIEAVLEYTGPADVTLATWTAAQFDLTQIEEQLVHGKIQNLRMIIDRSFVSRQPEFMRKVLERFGPGCVRATRTHAKFAVVHNDDWAVVLRTSMNLNHCSRMEYLQVTESRELANFWLQVSDAIFDETEEGTGSGWEAPALAALIGINPDPAVKTGDATMARGNIRMGA